MQQLYRPTAILTFIWIWAYKWNFLAFLRRKTWQNPSSTCTIFTQVSRSSTKPPHTTINEPYNGKHLGGKTRGQHQVLFDSCRNHVLLLDVIGIHLAGTREKSDNLQTYTNHTNVFSHLPPVEFGTRSPPNRQIQVWGNASPRHYIKLWQRLRVFPALLPQEKDSWRPCAGYRIFGFRTLLDLYPLRYIQKLRHPSMQRFLPSSLTCLLHVTCFGVKFHSATTFNHRLQIMEGDRTFTTKMSGAALMVSGDHLNLAYAPHGNSKHVSAPASPGGTTIRRWWRVDFPDFLGLAMVSAGCCIVAKSTDGSSRHWLLTECLSVNRNFPVGWGAVDF